jgi:protein phosphatase
MRSMEKIAVVSLGLNGRDTQDAHFADTRRDGTLVLAIADGVGGSSDGRRSSLTAINQVTKWAAGRDTNLSVPFVDTDAILREIVKTDDAVESLATTLTAVVVENGLATYGHVGDCRIYHLRGDGLRTVTHDQTEVAQLIAEGILSKQRARKYRRANVLISALGASTNYQFEAGHFEVASGDRLILCSDGIYKSVSKRELVALSLESGDAQELSRRLQRHLETNPPKDDATAIIFDI